MPDYRYNEAAGRYTNGRGQFVPAARVRATLDQTLATTAKRATALGDALQAGRISVATWNIEMRALIKGAHLYSGALAKGGWAQMTQADYGRIGQIVRKQYSYLEAFTRQIEKGLPLDGRFLRRVTMYVQAGRQTFHAVQRTLMRARGMTEERNRLGIAEHCDGCLQETARGWVPIGDLAPIGTRDCLAHCKCDVEYR